MKFWGSHCWVTLGISESVVIRISGPSTLQSSDSWQMVAKSVSQINPKFFWHPTQYTLEWSIKPLSFSFWLIFSTLIYFWFLWSYNKQYANLSISLSPDTLQNNSALSKPRISLQSKQYFFHPRILMLAYCVSACLPPPNSLNIDSQPERIQSQQRNKPFGKVCGWLFCLY